MRPIHTILSLVLLLFLGNVTSAQNLALNKAVTVSSVEGPLQEILLSMVISIRGGEVHLTSQNTFKWIREMFMH